MAIQTTKRGVAVGVACGLSHLGNSSLVESVRGAWECQGCHTAYATGEVMDAQRAHFGGREHGRSGVRGVTALPCR